MSISLVNDTASSTTSIPKEEVYISKEARLVDVLKTSSAARKLWEGVDTERSYSKLKPLQLRLLPAPVYGSSLAWCDPSRGVICLVKNDPTNQVQKEAHEDPKKVHRLLLELCNMAQQTKFLAIDAAVTKGYITSCAEYSKQLELVEFESCQMHDAIIDASLKEDGCTWDPSLASFKYNWKSSAQYLEAQKKTKHTEKYKGRFDDLVKARTDKTTSVKPVKEDSGCIIA